MDRWVAAISSTDSMQAGSQTKAVPEDGKDVRMGAWCNYLSKNASGGTPRIPIILVLTHGCCHSAHNAYLDGLRSKRRRRATKAVAPFGDAQGRFVGRACRKPTSLSGTGIPSTPAPPARRSS